MPAHQDWSVVDEERYQSVSFWLPLCDVDETNGGLAVLPGSQDVLKALRVNPSSLTPVPMERGQLMVFDQAVLHHSPPSTVDAPRQALVLASMPSEATMQHFWRRPDDDVIERYEVSDSSFFRLCTPGIAPASPEIQLVESFEFEPNPESVRTWIAERARYFG